MAQHDAEEAELPRDASAAVDEDGAEQPHQVRAARIAHRLQVRVATRIDEPIAMPVE